MHTEVKTDSKNVITSDNMDSKQANLQQEKQTDPMSDRHVKRMQNDVKDYQNSPHRSNHNNNHNNNRYNNRISNYGNRQNRNNIQQHRLDTNNNNNNNHKMQHHQNNYNHNHNGSYNGKILNGQEMANGNSDNSQAKKPLQKLRIVKSSNGVQPKTSSNYDGYQKKTIRVDAQLPNGDKNGFEDSGIHLNTSISNSNNINNNTITTSQDIRLKNDYLMAGDGDNINRKYSMEFLHQVGHQYKLTASPSTPQQQSSQNSSPKVLDDSNLALKMSLGDNSGYYSHLYTGAMYTNQLFFQPQQQQQYQTYARYQHQHLQQRMRMFQRQDGNYQRIFPQDSLINLQQHPNPIDQRTYNGYYQQQQQQQTPHHHNSFTLPNNRVKNNQNRKNRHNNNNNSTNFNGNGGKKLNGEHQNARISHTKSDTSAQHDDFNKRKNLMYIRTNSEEYRSLSPTPPSSVKSSSPGIQEKAIDTKDAINTEFNDDSASTTSSTRSVMSYSSENKEHRLTPTILLTPTHHTADVKENSVNMWINNNNFTPINNGLSISAEQLNVRAVETPVTVIKRPPSANGMSATTNHHFSHSIPSTLPTYAQKDMLFNYYFAQGDCCEVRDEPINLSCGSIWDHVSHEIWNKFQLFQQTRETYRSKMILWRDLYEFILGFPMFQQRACPKWGLFLVGSTISGFGLDSSDIDMCLVQKTAPQLDPRTEAMITLSTLKDYLISSGSTFQGFYLINAKVPILRFRDSTNTIEVDLNYNNCIGVRNTHLLYCYAQLDWRLRPLAIIVKLWAQYHNINDARNSTISSYSLVLMVIHFLQSAVSPPVLPCLHQKYPEKFKVLHDITTIDMMERLDTDWRSENYQSLGELFLRFLDYYSNFNYSRNAISIRTGGVLSIDECRCVKTPKNDPNHWQTLCIEEPFDLTNTARSAYDGEIFEKIKNVFFQSWRLLRECKTLDSLFQDQLFVQQSASQHQSHNTLNNQMMNDIKYIVYTPSPSLNSSPIIMNQMNPEIAS